MHVYIYIYIYISLNGRGEGILNMLRSKFKIPSAGPHAKNPPP